MRNRITSYNVCYTKLLRIITYGVLISERLNRSIVALLGAMLTIMTGILDQERALAGIDFNTIGLLVGMMIIVSITRITSYNVCYTKLLRPSAPRCCA